MILPLAMTVAGSVPVILFFLYRLISGENFDAKSALKLLKLSIFFFLAPMQLIYHFMPLESDIFPSVIHYNSEGMYIINFEGKYQFQYDDCVVLVPYWLIALFCLSTIVMLSFLLYETYSYRKARNAISQTGHVAAPLTIGFFKPRILLPDDVTDEGQIRMLYTHEQGHVRQHDAIFRFLCLLVLCLHWYNPFAWLLFVTYPFISECACDQNATSHISREERIQYSTMLINFAVSTEPFPRVWKNSFSSGKKEMKKRLTYIMKRTHRTVINTLVLIAFFILSVASSCMTVIAYSPLEKVNPMTAPDYTITDITLIPEGVEDPELALEDFSVSDTILITEDNKIIPILSSSASAYSTCSHTYVNGTQKTHNRNSSGGCVVTTYKVQYCSKCKYIKSKSFWYNVPYDKCPH